MLLWTFSQQCKKSKKSKKIPINFYILKIYITVKFISVDAENFDFRKTKVASTISHSVAPYFHDMKFQEMLGEALLPKLLQVSMDGPNIQCKFYDYLTKNHSETHNKELIDIDSFGLHLIHRAFQKGKKMVTKGNKKADGT